MYTYDPIEMYVPTTNMRNIQGSSLIASDQLTKRLFFRVISGEAHGFLLENIFTHRRIDVLQY